MRACAKLRCIKSSPIIVANYLHTASATTRTATASRSIVINSKKHRLGYHNIMSKLFVRLASSGVGFGFGLGLAVPKSRSDGTTPLTQEQLKQLVSDLTNIAVQCSALFLYYSIFNCKFR